MSEPAVVEKNPLVTTITNYRREAQEARRDRMDLNLRNFDFFHHKQDFSHKRKGQSREFLPKQPMAVEHITSFVHQGLIDLGDWFSIEASPGNKKPLLSPDEARNLVSRHLQKTGFYTLIQDAIKSGLLGSLMIVKVHGRVVQRPIYFTEKKKSFLGTQLFLKKKKKTAWELRIELVRQKDYYPDPTGEGLYELQDIEMDLWQLKELAKARPDIYDVSQVNELEAYMAREEEALTKVRENGQNETYGNFRKRVVVTECWGTILDPQGGLLFENGVCAIANDQFVIRKPQPNPLWHGKSPFVVTPLLRVPHSVHHKALMDAPTALNQAMNEIFNLKLDAGIMSVFGVRQVHENWIDNVDEISDGISPGMTLKANSSCPPGQKVFETVSTGSLSQESDGSFQLASAEFHESALTNDLRMGGLPARAVKATEVVEASQAITSVFTGLAKTIEEMFVAEVLDRGFYTIMQHMDDLDTSEMKSLFGEKRAEELANLSPEERFEKTVDGHDFRVFGLTQTLNKIKDFKKLTSLLQTIAGNPTLAEEFAKKNDYAKLLDEIMKALDINVDKIKHGEEDEIMNGLGGDAGAATQGPDMNSQMTQMSATTPEEQLSSTPQEAFPQGGNAS